MNERIAAVIVAAGQSTRFGAPKILHPIAGTPVIVRTVHAFLEFPSWSSFVLVVSPELKPGVEALFAGELATSAITIVTGGERRQDSVAAGLNAIGDDGIVVIHDGARPLVNSHMIDETIAAVRSGADAAVAAIPVSDTLKRRQGAGIETVNRADLWRAQTPQAFRVSPLRRAMQEADRRGLTLTDESMAIELIGGTVALTSGDEQNIKLTTPGDAAVLEALARVNSDGPANQIRTGIGYDVHRLVPGRPLVLGGVEIPSDLGLDGHSDADVLLHAVADAVLGACALGDIGQHFPPSDDAYLGISSVRLLEQSAALVSETGFRIVNVDATVIAESPRIGPHATEMREIIARALATEPSAISIKATTNERLGFAGRREGIAAMAIATVRGPA